jgi:non-specific serine/threonine protein kinase
VFAGGWQFEAAEVVCADPLLAPFDLLDLLAALVDKSLVVADTSGEAARYSLLDSIHAYATERLEAADEAEATRDRHAGCMLLLARAAGRALVGPAQNEWVRRLERERHNVRAALAWSIERNDGETALRLCAVLSTFWYIRGYYREGRDWITRALACEPATPSRARAAALHGAASMADIQHDHAEARRLIAESVAIWRITGDRRGLASSLAELGMHARHQGDFGAARRACEEALQIYAGSPDPWGQRLALGVLGWVAEAEGDRAAAQRLLEQSLAAARATGSPVDVALQLNNLGILALRRGDVSAAVACYGEALPLAQGVDAREPLACSLEGLAGVAAARGLARRAALLIGAAAALREAIGSPRIAQFEEEYLRLAPALGQALGEEAFAAAVAEGRSLPLHDAITLALGETQPWAVRGSAP